MTRRLIIDTDTAGDDTTAILIALAHFKVEGITITAGNVAFEQQIKNALTTLELVNPQNTIGVYPGHQSPMMSLPDEIHTTVEDIQGATGMGDGVFPDPVGHPQKEHAVDFLIRMINENPGEIEILAIGPLTNIAMAVKRNPQITQNIKHLWIMGGVNNALGNINVTAEYNFYVDPEAAKIVLHSNIPTTLLTWDACLNYGVLYDKDIAPIHQLNTKGSQFFLDINLFVKAFEKKKRGIDGITCTDSLLAALAADDRLLLAANYYFVDVETMSPMTRGYNLVDRERELNRSANARIIEKIDSQAFKALLLDVLGKID